jgi:hypothetical protein
VPGDQLYARWAKEFAEIGLQYLSKWNTPKKPKHLAAPGWLMTADQRSLYWRLWAAACEYQGWDRLSAGERDQKRREVLAGLGFASVQDVDHTEGFDCVKHRLEGLSTSSTTSPPMPDCAGAFSRASTARCVICAKLATQNTLLQRS